MLLTRIWAALLSLLATAFLAGMFLLSAGTSGGFTDSDRTAIRAVTEAGLAAFEADIQSSPASLGPSLLTDSRLREALEGERGKRPAGLEPVDLPSTLTMVANEGLLESYPLMSVALIDKSGTVVAKTGLDEELFDDLARLGAFGTAQADAGDALFSATLGGKLFAVKLSRPETGEQARRLVSLHPVDLGGGSFLRRVLGSSNPAGLVRDGKLLGEAIGGASPGELVELVSQNLASAPPEGSSSVFEVGAGSDRRLGAIGRVPGPAGRGESGTIFAVLSLNTEGATQKDLAQALSEALDKASDRVSWPLVFGLLVISLALSLYLPHLEVTSPLRRLAQEFHGLAQGTQQQIFPDAYGGLVGQVARSALPAHVSVRARWEGELALEEEDAEQATPPGGARITRGTRATRSGRRTGRTRRNEAVEKQAAAPEAIALPDAPAEDAVVERHSHADTPAAPPPAAKPGAAKPAPTLTDDVDDRALGLLGEGAEPASAAQRPGPGARGRSPTILRSPSPAPIPTPVSRPSTPPPPAPAATPPAPPAPATGSEDPREAYFREVFQEFLETKKACGESLVGFTYDKFARKLRQNTQDLMSRPGTRDVKFTVYVKDGKAALKAKVVKD